MEQPAMPKHMHLNLTMACNMRCRICRTEDSKLTDTLTKEVIDKAISEAFDHLKQLRLDSGGELLLSKHLTYVLEEATKRNIPIFVSTNGALMTKEKAEMLCKSSLDTIQVSIDSPDKKTLEWIRRGAKFEDVLKGASNLVEARNKVNRFGKPQIDFHAALFKNNLEQLPDLVRLAKKIGVDSVGIAYGYTHSHMNPEDSVFWCRDRCNEVVEDARMLASEIGIGFNGPSKFNTDTYIIAMPNRYCQYLFEWSYVDPSGKVFPCCISTYEMGDLNRSSFTDIWYGDRYNALRASYNTSKPTYYKCATCYITSEWNPEDYKVHFHPDHYEYVTNRLKILPEKKYKYCSFAEYVFPGELNRDIEAVINLQNDGHFEKSLTLMESIATIYFDLVDVNNLYAEILIQNNDKHKAKLILENIIGCFPQNGHALNNLAIIEINNGNFTRALELLKRVLEQNPKDKAARETLDCLRDEIEATRQ